MANPHFVPELTIKVTVINFTVTPEGLEDQLLAEVVKHERIDLEQTRVNLIKQISQDSQQLKNFEQTILLQITEAGSKILDDDKLVNTLDNTRIMSQIIQERMVVAKTTQESISLARDSYREIAKRGSVLYFVVSELSKINHMYRWSLDYFIQFFNRRLRQSQQSAVLKERVQILIVDLT
jgi:dynein heavy chain, axonemal